MPFRDYLVRATGTHEGRHRRLVLFATGVLILLATSPVLAHHVGSRLDQLLAGRDHVWVICVIAVHQMMAPVHEVFHGLLVVGLSYAVWDRGRAWLVVRRLLRTVDAVHPTPGDAFGQLLSLQECRRSPCASSTVYRIRPSRRGGSVHTSMWHPNSLQRFPMQS